MSPFSESDVSQGTALLNLVSLVLTNIQLVTDQKSRFRELQQLNKQLENAQNQLLQADKMSTIGQLAAGVAHEINNPIGFVNSNLGSLRRYMDDLFSLMEGYEQWEVGASGKERVDELKKSLDLPFIREDVYAILDESEDGIGRVKKIVQDLKDFSHVDEAEWQFIDIHKGLESTLNIVRNELRYKATIVKEYAMLPEIECLPSQLNQVFMNLLVNAAHALGDGGTITLRTGKDKDMAWIDIEDTGHGIPKEHLGRIFDPFFTTKPVGKGTGLGLSLSYSIVEKHGGRIDVKSVVGQGTTFRILLPLQQPVTAS